MDYKVFYTQRALSDLEEIIGWIAEDSPGNASKFGGALLEHIEVLSRFPRIGSLILARRSVRKLVHTPLLVYYTIHERNRAVEVLHIRHGMRRRPTFEID